MICGNELARQWKTELEIAAHVSTAGVRVTITHPRFEWAVPEYQNGTVRLPACIFDGTDEWKRTWKHELQHAHDDRTGLLWVISREDAERRARAAEQHTTEG